MLDRRVETLFPAIDQSNTWSLCFLHCLLMFAGPYLQHWYDFQDFCLSNARHFQTLSACRRAGSLQIYRRAWMIHVSNTCLHYSCPCLYVNEAIPKMVLPGMNHGMLYQQQVFCGMQAFSCFRSVGGFSSKHALSAPTLGFYVCVPGHAPTSGPTPRVL